MRKGLKLTNWGKQATASPLSIREKFSVVSDDDPVALWIGFFLDVDFKIDGAHDAVAEHFVNQGFHSRAVYLGNFVEAIDQWIYRNACI
jgi:hypothetical protein